MLWDPKRSNFDPFIPKGFYEKMLNKFPFSNIEIRMHRNILRSEIEWRTANEFLSLKRKRKITNAITISDLVINICYREIKEHSHK